MYVVGDIELSEKALQDSLIAIRLARDERVPVIFLGDILVGSNLTTSLANLERIFIELKIPIRPYLNDDSSIEDVKIAFEEIYKTKRLYVFNASTNRLNPTQRMAISGVDPAGMNYVFLFGNKELDLIRDFSSLHMGIITVDRHFKTSFCYRCRQKRQRLDIDVEIDKLNIILTYLNLCHIYVRTENVIISHIYTNAMIFRDDQKSVICGHSRCFGNYIDKNYPDVKISMLDVSTEPSDVDIVNRMYVDENGDTTFYTKSKKVMRLLRETMSANATFLNVKLISINPHMSTRDLFEIWKETMDGTVTAEDIANFHMQFSPDPAVRWAKLSNRLLVDPYPIHHRKPMVAVGDE